MKDKYVNGLKMENFTHIKGVGHYNNNYHIGFDGDLLFAKSDDDNTTDWYLVIPIGQTVYLGQSKTSEGDLLEVYDQVPS